MGLKFGVLGGPQKENNPSNIPDTDKIITCLNPIRNAAHPPTKHQELSHLWPFGNFTVRYWTWPSRNSEFSHSNWWNFPSYPLTNTRVYIPFISQDYPLSNPMNHYQPLLTTIYEPLLNYYLSWFTTIYHSLSLSLSILIDRVPITMIWSNPSWYDHNYHYIILVYPIVWVN